MHKYFSLSPRYAAWYDYRTPAVGFGIHVDVVKQNVPIRLILTQIRAMCDKTSKKAIVRGIREGSASQDRLAQPQMPPKTRR